MKSNGGSNWIGYRVQDPRIYQIVATFPLIPMQIVHIRDLH
ncbi:hypothetical protein A2U01_0095362, partial [Trifolium medium]|nr:hypothetical protein [Trifolium medium]